MQYDEGWHSCHLVLCLCHICYQSIVPSILCCDPIKVNNTLGFPRQPIIRYFQQVGCKGGRGARGTNASFWNKETRGRVHSTYAAKGGGGDQALVINFITVQGGGGGVKKGQKLAHVLCTRPPSEFSGQWSHSLMNEWSCYLRQAVIFNLYAWK